MRYFNRLAIIVIAAIVLGGIPIFLLHPTSPTSPSAPGQQAGASTPTPAASVAVAPLPAKQSGKVTLTAQGFAPGETVDFRATVQPGNLDHPTATVAPAAVLHDLQQVRADARGGATAKDVVLPEELVSGAHVLEAIGQSSGRHAALPLLIRAKNPWLTLGNYSVKPGGTVGLIFGGFPPSGQVQLSLEPAPKRADGSAQEISKLSPPVSLTQAPTDAVGNATWKDVPIPLLKPGSYTLVAQNGDRATADFVVVPLSPVVQLSPWSGPPGASVALNARGFAANERIQVFVGQSTTAALDLNADQYGNFWGGGPIRVPVGTNGGSLPIRIVGLASAAEDDVAFTVQNTKPWLELTSWSGPPGAPVGFGGGGWAAGERVTIHQGTTSGPAVAEGQADDQGWLRGNAESAAVGNGNLGPGDATTQTVTFVATGEQSHASASATFTIVNPFAGIPRDLPNNNPPPPPPPPP
jgi:hypothetical protein